MSGLIANAQSDSSTKEELITFPTVETKAEFQGGHDSMLRFIAANVKYPSFALENEISGMVVIAFVVEADGSVTGVKVASTRKLGFGLEEAAMDVVQSFPPFKPATLLNKPVRMKMLVPIRFVL